MRTTILFLLIIGIVLLIIIVYPGNHLLFSQNSEDLPLSQIPTETVKIVKPITTQNVSTGDELMLLGQSSDNTLKNCSVSVIVNNVRPYQNALARGAGGANDFSEWEFVLHNNYTQIIEGENKITSKLLCPSALTRWYSVLINGVPSDGNRDVFSSVRPEEQQDIPTANLSGTSDMGGGIQPEEQQDIPTANLSGTGDMGGGIQPEEQQDIPTANLSGTGDMGGNNNVMLVSISPEKDPVARGDTQNATITVTDSDSRAIANAEINGKLIYPGGNYEKEFSGITDSQGKFIYSWTIGNKGDVGPLSIEVEVSNQGYPSSSAKDSFEIADNS